MSHCTKFDFQYTDKDLICEVFNNLGLEFKNTIVKTYGMLKWDVEEHPELSSFSPGRNSIVAKKGKFNYFMENYGDCYKLSVERHNMNLDDIECAKIMEDEYRKEYIKAAAQKMVNKMQIHGHNALLTQTEEELKIMFGNTFEKSISIKYNQGSITEEVNGVKGKSCISLTKVLEEMLSSSDTEIKTDWTNEYYESSPDGIAVYELEQY